MENIVIREAKIDDAAEVAKVHVKSWQVGYKGQIPEDFLTNLSVERRTKTRKEILSKSSPKSKHLVADLFGRIVGFCDIGPSRDDNVGENTGELYAIYVDPEYMKKGIGTRLLQQATEELKQLGFIQATLWVLTSNNSGRSFYEKNGWRSDGTIKDEKSHDESFVFHEIRYRIDL